MIERGLVSVVTPVYNGEAYVSRLLDSVLVQGYSHIEMILVDDGSADGTYGIAAAYVPKFEAKGYSLQIIRAPHRNASAAINEGLRHVTGEYLVWPDADDELYPDSIARRVGFLKEHPEYECVRSLMAYVPEEIGESVPEQATLGDMTKEELFWDILEDRTFSCSGCYMLKTEEFFHIYSTKKIPEYDVGQNYQMLLPFLFRNKCPTIPEKLYRVYVRPDSHSRQKRTEAEETFRYQLFEDLVDEILEICGLTDNRAAVDRIALWKARRRAYLLRKNRHTGKFFQYKAVAIWFLLKSLLHRVL